MARILRARPTSRGRLVHSTLATLLALATLCSACDSSAPAPSESSRSSESSERGESGESAQSAESASAGSAESPDTAASEQRPDNKGTDSPLARSPVRAFRFAGVSLLYALRRIAHAGDAVLCVDEVRGASGEQDLHLRSLDADLPAGTLKDALDALQQMAGGFDYEFHESVLYVRSRLTVDTRTPLDMKFIPGAVFEGHLISLVGFIMRLNQRAYLRATKTIGEPVFRNVKFTIPDNSSIRDVFIEYAKALDHGWVMRRSGRMVRHGPGQAFVASTIDLLRPLDEPRLLRLALLREETVLEALANVAKRTQRSMVVLDRSPFTDSRGELYSKHDRDPGLPFEASIEDLIAGNPGREDRYNVDFTPEVPVLRSHFSNFRVSGKQILRAKLEEADFEGSLPELGRWLNKRLPEGIGVSFLSGEILGGEPRARIHVDNGMTVLDVLIRFAAESGDSPAVTIAWAPDMYPNAKAQNLWKGAYLRALRTWESPGG